MKAGYFGLGGLALLVGATDLLVKGLGLTLAALPLLTLFGLALPTLRRQLDGAAYWLGVLLLAALLTSLVDLALHASAFELRRALGPYPYLLALPCLQLAGAPATGALDGLRAGLLFALLALLLGALREILGHASLFAHLDWLLGPGARSWPMRLGTAGIPLFALAPGAFILLGTLLALSRHLTPRIADRR